MAATTSRLPISAGLNPFTPYGLSTLVVAVVFNYLYMKLALQLLHRLKQSHGSLRAISVLAAQRKKTCQQRRSVIWIPPEIWPAASLHPWECEFEYCDGDGLGSSCNLCNFGTTSYIGTYYKHINHNMKRHHLVDIQRFTNCRTSMVEPVPTTSQIHFTQVTSMLMKGGYLSF